MHISLEPLTRQYLGFIRDLRNQHRKHFFDTHPLTWLQHEGWYLNFQKNSEAGLARFWVIHNSKSSPIGTICRNRLRYVSLNPGEIPEVLCRVYELGNLMLLPAYQGRGIMQEALHQVTALEPLAFYIAHVKPSNRPSLHTFKRAGFWRVPHARP